MISSKGFVPRGKNTLTSRLFVLERVKKELEKQIAANKLLNKNNLTTTTISSIVSDEDEDEDPDYDDNLLESNFLEDLKINPTSCAFLSNDDSKCLTNEQVYNLLNNRSDLMKLTKPIEQQINKPNERTCASIDLSSCFFSNFISFLLVF
jgi:hypothetical protein